MKTCTHCNIEKPLDAFGIRNTKKGTYQSWCRSCVKDHDASTYKTSTRKQYLIDKTAEYRIRNRKHLWDYFLDHPCVQCGETDPRVLEFDHIDPSIKTRHVCEMASAAVSIETLNAEIAKCRVLCANCHRRHTYTQQGWLTF